jgi:hypothetical protein
MSMNPRKAPHNQPESDNEDADLEPAERALLSEKKLERRERESYKHSFLTKFFEKSEEESKSRTPKEVVPTPKGILTNKIPLSKTISDARQMQPIEAPEPVSSNLKPKFKVPFQKAK